MNPEPPERDEDFLSEAEALAAQDFDPPKMPYPKVTAAALAGAVTTIVVFVVGLLGVDVPPTVAAALTTLLAFVAGYLRIE